jgi:hypothetical protein
MTKNYTTDFILKYLYNELTANEAISFEIDMHHDTRLFKKVNELQKSIKALNEISFEPSKTSVDLILEYSEKLANKQKKPV